VTSILWPKSSIPVDRQQSVTSVLSIPSINSVHDHPHQLMSITSNLGHPCHPVPPQIDRCIPYPPPQNLGYRPDSSTSWGSSDRYLCNTTEINIPTFTKIDKYEHDQSGGHIKHESRIWNVSRIELWRLMDFVTTWSRTWWWNRTSWCGMCGLNQKRVDRRTWFDRSDDVKMTADVWMSTGLRWSEHDLSVMDQMWDRMWQHEIDRKPEMMWRMRCLSEMTWSDWADLMCQIGLRGTESPEQGRSSLWSEPSTTVRCLWGVKITHNLVTFSTHGFTHVIWCRFYHFRTPRFDDLADPPCANVCKLCHFGDSLRAFRMIDPLKYHSVISFGVVTSIVVRIISRKSTRHYLWYIRYYRGVT
jgi:hypothetical protein